MNKRSMTVLILIALCAVIILQKLLYPKQDNNHSLNWVPEKSYFIDCEITDKNTARIRYSIHFVNKSEHDMKISLSAKFSKKEIHGCIKYEFLEGCNETGERLYEEIKSGESVDIMYVFEGEFLGSNIVNNLSFPEELLISHYFQ